MFEIAGLFADRPIPLSRSLTVDRHGHEVLFTCQNKTGLDLLIACSSAYLDRANNLKIYFETMGHKNLTLRSVTAASQTVFRPPEDVCISCCLLLQQRTCVCARSTTDSLHVHFPHLQLVTPVLYYCESPCPRVYASVSSYTSKTLCRWALTEGKISFVNPCAF